MSFRSASNQPPQATLSYEQGTYTDEDAANDPPVVGLVGEVHAVLMTIKSAADLKLVRGDSHLIAAVSGPGMDIIHLSREIKEYCFSGRHLRSGPAPLESVIARLHWRGQRYIYQPHLRVYAEGMLIAGYDHTGPHLYHVESSGTSWDLPVAAIGPSARPAWRYLGAHVADISTSSATELVEHGFLALRECLGPRLTLNDVAIGILGYNLETKTDYGAVVLKGDQIHGLGTSHSF